MPIIFAGVNEGDSPMDIVGSHQRCLVAALMRVPTGPVLELGVGWYSTPIMHEICKAQHRSLYTFDNNMDWLGQFMALNSPYHTLQHIGWWGDLPLLDYYGVVFVDQGQPAEREYSIRSLIGRTDVFVMHDTEEGFAYGYNRTLPMFKYQYTDRCQKAWTTIASNTVDVTKWMIDLSPVEPTQDIT